MRQVLLFQSVGPAVEDRPGAYILVNGFNEPVYVGRADKSLAVRLGDHIIRRETNRRIRERFPTAAYFQYTRGPWEAYQLESQWYSICPNLCNEIAPAAPALIRLRPWVSRPHSPLPLQPGLRRLMDAMMGKSYGGLEGG